jgi:hypothetical protein
MARDRVRRRERPLWGGAFATTYWADPKEGLIGQIYTNLYQNSAPELVERFGTLVYSAIVK